MEYPKISQEINYITNDNLKKLQKLFPSVVKDGLVDFDALKEELGEFKEVDKEKYELTWSGKQNAKKLSQEDVYNRTLNYIEEDSKNTDTTENLYIEGDNLEVLKLLRQNYYGAIKVIYIDPPYNTGNDFVYNDNFLINKKDSDIAEGTKDEDGNPLQKNIQSSNRYHANWLNMMYPRLKVAKDLLTDDGVIFISIDDNEQDNLKKVCDEVFGEENLINCICVKMSEASGVKMSHVQKRMPKLKEYTLVYKKNEQTEIRPIKITKGKWDSEYNTLMTGLKPEEFQLIDSILEKDELEERDLVKLEKLLNRADFISITDYCKLNSIKEKSEIEVFKWENDYRIFRTTATSIGFTEKIIEYRDKNKINSKFFYYLTPEKKLYIIKNPFDNKNKKPRLQVLFAKDYLDTNPGDFWSHIKTTGLDNEGFITFKNGKKPLRLLNDLLRIGSNADSYILDFFSGSATSAHAVMQLNAEDGGKRKFIMVQLPEETDEKSEVYKEGYKNICEIGKERIRRAGEKIKEEIEKENAKLKEDEEPKKVPDIGFKVFRTADTNIKWNEIYNMGQIDFDTTKYSPDLADFKMGFNDIDIVYEVMLRQKDVPLSSTLETLIDIGNRTYLYGSAYLVCLETSVTEEMVEKLSSIDPLPIKFIFRDSAFKDDINLKDETFRRLKNLIEKNSGNSKTTYTVEFI